MTNVGVFLNLQIVHTGKQRPRRMSGHSEARSKVDGEDGKCNKKKQLKTKHK